MNRKVVAVNETEKMEAYKDGVLDLFKIKFESDKEATNSLGGYWYCDDGDGFDSEWEALDHALRWKRFVMRVLGCSV